MGAMGERFQLARITCKYTFYTDISTLTVLCESPEIDIYLTVSRASVEISCKTTLESRSDHALQCYVRTYCVHARAAAHYAADIERVQRSFLLYHVHSDRPWHKKKIVN